MSIAQHLKSQNILQSFSRLAPIHFGSHEMDKKLDKQNGQENIEGGRGEENF